MENKKWLYRSMMLAALSTALIGCDKSVIKPIDHVAKVDVLQLGNPEVTDRLYFPAIAQAALRSHLSFRVSGEITELVVKEGDKVKKGDLLAQLDKRDFQIAVDNAKASYAAINSQYRRSQPLVKKGLLAQSQFDELKAQRSVALVDLKLAQLYLQFTTLTAPTDGIISRVNVDRFENIQVGQQIVNIHSVNDVEVLIQVPDRLFVHQPTQRDLRKVTAKVKTESGSIYDAKIQEFTTEPDPATGTYNLTLIMPMPEQEVILDGMALEVTARSSDAGLNVSVGTDVPLTAVINADGDDLDRAETYVWVLEGDKVRKQQVELGKMRNTTIQIISGLEGAEQIVVKGVSQLRDGSVVKVIKKEAVQ
ncbi:efflux transporter periplasmic adaptor subunit [Vibrio sp. UCD-FRSSP16_10]|uniref:efflux RND transporter periplasmic adaptor subunit n=1 Tax=unclassified Vibrio TaxID=2614977 RepID=UPI0007FD1BC2|nr:MULTISPECIES: efflux RND transporter periplasmic adaptor subunit [unclassified Vibrio]OBT13886.1 efflux transporter periplasmic adaptor subunit [Vibrio sp. UCD-FRSSP16_30]OBT22767.1 efflux transporter periplasmic adaptor subunit [Vibrio sp. UCD-FRSSP16_10]